jgi:hypothetical protein
MGLQDYSPSDTFPDVDGTGRLGSSGGPLQFPQDGDPFTYAAHYVNAAANGGLFGKIVNGLLYLAKRMPQAGQTSIVEQSFLEEASHSPAYPISPGTAGLSSAGDTVQQMLTKLQNGMKLTSVAFWAKPDSHGSLPQFMPNFRVYRQPIVGGGSAVVIGASVTDPSGSTGAYDVAHAITCPITAGSGTTYEIVDLTQNVYYGVYISESGTNSDANAVLYGCVMTVAYV